jgi:NitT/TauT family transport system substrate-binding protein
MTAPDAASITSASTSGPPITNQMLAGKLSFGVMGDYPLIVNGAKFHESNSGESRFIALTG